ncbi:MAG: hypothetical protein CMH49_09815, partial [Myxococcales bacterium]|nr:hypothetical protein [Myxococcales bacterium]
MTDHDLPLESLRQPSVAPYHLKNTLFKVGRFVLEQGTHYDHSRFALAFISRYYQALNLWPVDFTERIFDYAQELNSQDRVALGQDISKQLRHWLPTHIDEIKVADFFRSVCLVLNQCDGNLLTLLSAFNEEILSPFKTRFNPRKLIEVEERMGSALYLAILELTDDAPSQFIPQSKWPQIAEYTLLQSLAPVNNIFPFVALRNSDHLKCILYISDQVIQLLPGIELSEWPIHCIKPVESGRSEVKNTHSSTQETRELYWVSLPATGPINLTDLLPFTDIYTALYIGEQLLETLAALHQLGIPFRNLSPNQVVIDHRFQLQLLPYLEYQARDRAWSGESTLRATDFESIYISPEQRLAQRGDLRSDLWSFGAIFYELVMKAPLIQTPSLLELSELDSTSGITPLSDDFTNNLKLIVKRCLHPNPDHRWSDAQRVLENYRPIAIEVRQNLKSRGRSAQWSRVIGDGVLRSFIDQNIHAPPHPVNPAFFSFLENQEVPLSTAEDPSALLTTIFAQEEALNEDIGKWSILFDEAEQAQKALIFRIKDEVPTTTYEHLEDLLEEKVLIKEALLQAESKIAFFERRRPKLFALALERFVEDSELKLDLQELLDLDWSLVDPLPEHNNESIEFEDDSSDFDELDVDFIDEDSESEESVASFEKHDLKVFEDRLKIDEIEILEGLISDGKTYGVGQQNLEPLQPEQSNASASKSEQRTVLEQTDKPEVLANQTARQEQELSQESEQELSQESEQELSQESEQELSQESEQELSQESEQELSQESGQKLNQESEQESTKAP